MVQIFSGNSLGLQGSSLGQLGNFGPQGTAGLGQCGVSAYMNVCNGNLVLTQKDGALVTAGMRFQLLNTYNSQGDKNQPWCLNTQTRLIFEGGGSEAGSIIIRVAEDGHVTRFQFDVDKRGYFSSDGSNSLLLQTKTGWSYQSADPLAPTFEYDTQGLLTCITDAAHHQLTCNYQDGHLVSIVDEMSRQKVTWQFNKEQLSDIYFYSDGELSHHIRYEYDGNYRISRIAQDQGDGCCVWVAYDYVDDTNLIHTIRQSDGCILGFAYDDHERIIRITDGEGRATSFEYHASYTELCDASGVHWIYRYDDSGHLLVIDGPQKSIHYEYENGYLTRVTQGSLQWRFTYNNAGDCILMEEPSGKITQRAFDSKHHLVYEKESSLQASIAEVKQRYFLYDSAGLLRCTVDENGTVTEYRYDARGLCQSQHRYLQNPFTSPLSISMGLEFSELEQWIKIQPLNVQEIHEFYYDWRGQVVREIFYQTLDEMGNGFKENALETYYAYDAKGRLIQKTKSSEQKTYAQKFCYDAQDRLILILDNDHIIRRFDYDDEHRRCIETDARGLHTLSLYDKSGLLLSRQQISEQKDFGSEKYTYDALGRLVCKESSEGTKQYYFYSQEGQLTGVIGKSGVLVEYQYDKEGRLSKTIEYANNPIQSQNSFLSQLAQVRPASSRTDRVSCRYYNAFNQLAWTTDARGAAIEYRYNPQGILKEKISYAKPQVVPENARPFTPVTDDGDRHCFYYYDSRNQLLAEVNGEGAVIGYQYDRQGNCIERCQYYTRVTIASCDFSWEQIKPVHSSKDIHDFYCYNQAGLKTAHIDGEGYVTTFCYNSQGLLSEQREYYTALDEPDIFVRSNGHTLPLLSKNDHSTQYRYDEHGWLIEERKSSGAITTFHYDACGLLTEKASFDETAGHIRQSCYRYDEQGRLIAQLPPLAAKALSTPGMSVEQIEEIWRRSACHYTYDDAGRLVRKTNSLQQNSDYFYNGKDQLIFELNSDGVVRENQYNHFGEISVIHCFTAKLAYKDTYTAKELEQLVALQEKTEDQTTILEYNVCGQLVLQRDGENREMQYNYNFFGEKECSVRNPQTPLSVKTIFAYDRRGLLLNREELRDGTAIQCRWHYDSFGRIIGMVDARNNKQDYRYNKRGERITLLDAGNSAWYTEYDAFGRVLYETDGSGSFCRIIYSYDDENKRLTIFYPEKTGQTSISFNAFGERVVVRKENGSEIRTTYNENGQVLEQEEVDGTVTAYTYDDSGQILEIREDNKLRIVYSYDASGHIIVKVEDPLGFRLATSYKFDGLGRELMIEDACGIQTLFTYDEYGNLKSQCRDPDGLRILSLFQYDINGHLIEQTICNKDGNDRVIAYNWDAAGRCIEKIIDPKGLALRTQWTYDANDNCTSETDGRGNTRYWIYDAMNRCCFAIDNYGAVTEQRFDANGHNNITIKYAQAIATKGNLCESEMKSRVCAGNDDIYLFRKFNSEGQLILDFDALGFATAYRYDSQGNKTQITRYAQAASIDDLKSGKHPVLSMAGARTTFLSYDKFNHLRYQKEENQGITEFFYNPQGQLLRKTRFAQALNLGNLEFNCDNIEKNLQRDIAKDQTTLYHYDALGRLDVECNAEGYATRYDYDNLGNRITIYCYAQSIEVTDDWSATLKTDVTDRCSHIIYDAAGRLIFHISAEGQVEQRTYDENNNIIAETIYGAPIFLKTYDKNSVESALLASSKRQIRSHFDAANRMIDRSDTQQHTEFTYDSNNNLSSKTESGITWRYDYDVRNLLVTTYTPEVNLIDYENGQWMQSCRSIKTSNSYDLFGRLIAIIKDVDKQRLTRQFAYDKQGQCLAVIYPDTIIDNSTNAPSMYRQELSCTLSEEKIYNAFGEVIAKKDKADAWEYYLYDNSVLRFSINKEGALTEYEYNELGYVANKTCYALLLDGHTGGSSEEIIRNGKKISTNDRHEYYQYDKLGRLVVLQKDSVNSFNAASRCYAQVQPTVHYTYNAFNDITKTSTRVYDNIWSSVLSFYNKDGKVRAIMNADHYLTTFAYDGYGQMIQQTEFAQRQQDFDLNTPPSADVSDRIFCFAYDVLGRLISKKQCNVPYQSISANGEIEYHCGDLLTQYAYDSFNHQTKVIDALGNITSFVYDKLGNLQAKIEPINQRMHALTSYAYDSMGQLVQIRKYANNAEVDSEGCIFCATSTNDIETRSVYNKQGQVIVSLDGENQSIQYSYDKQGNRTRSWQMNTNNSGLQLIDKRFLYDKEGHQLQATTLRANGTRHCENYQFNAFGEVITKDVNGDDQLRYEYDRLGRVWRSNYAGFAQIFVYDLTDKVTQIVRSTNSFTPEHGDAGIDLMADSFLQTESFQEDVWAVQLQRQNNIYDNSGNIQEQYYEYANAEKPQELTVNRQYYLHDRWGNMVQHTNSKGYTSYYEFSALNNLVRQKLPEVAIYDGQNENSIAPELIFANDALGRQIASIDANGHQTTKILNVQGAAEEEFDAKKEKKQKVYNIFGLVQKSTNERGGITSYRYDKNNRLIEINTNGSIQRTFYDASGQCVSQQNGDGDIIRYRYDETGLMIAKCNEQGAWQYYGYDEQGHKIAEIDALGIKQTWDYDRANGRLVRHQDLGGRTTSYRYNQNGLLLEELSSSGRHIVYHYQGDGNIVQFADIAGNEVINYGYDSEGQLISKQSSRVGGSNEGWNLENDYYLYDALGRLANVKRLRPDDTDERFPDKDQTIFSVDYQYDAVGNLCHTRITSNQKGNEATSCEEYYSYDANNRMTINKGILRDNKVTIGIGQGSEQSYDASGNLVSSFKYEQGVLQKYIYGYDSSNQHCWTSKNGLTLQTKAYNNCGQIIEERLFDSRGNLALVNSSYYRHGVLEQLKTDVIFQNKAFTTRCSWFQYDLAGNILSEIQQGYERANQHAYLMSHTYNYEWWDSYQQATDILCLQNGQGVATSQSKRYYDNNGQLSLIIEQSTPQGDVRASHYLTSANEGIRARRDDNGQTDYLSLAGRLIGDVRHDNDGKQAINIYGGFIGQGSSLPAIKNSSFGLVSEARSNDNAVVSINTPQEAIGSYTVQAGDSLQSIALKVFGDSSLWYIIADANGFPTQKGANTNLPTGQRILLPALCISTHQTASTHPILTESHFLTERIVPGANPFPITLLSPSQVHFDRHHHMLAKIASGIVAVFATVLTAALAASFSGIALASCFTGLLKTGLAVLNGGLLTTEGTIAASCAAGFAGSMAGQMVANLAGIQQGIDWSSALAAALGTAATAGLLRGARSSWGQRAVAWLQDNSPQELNLSNMALSTSQDILQQGIGNIIEGNRTFDWQRLGANALISGLGAGKSGRILEQGLDSIDEHTGVLKNELSSGLTNATKNWLSRHSENGRTIFGDNPGQILGDGIVNGLVFRAEERTQRIAQNHRVKQMMREIEINGDAAIQDEQKKSIFSVNRYSDYNDLLAYGESFFNDKKEEISQGLDSLKSAWRRLDEDYHILDELQNIKFSSAEPPSLAENIFSISIDFIPVLGQLKAARELWTGEDLVTCAKTSRIFAAATLIPGGAIAAKSLKWLGKSRPAIMVLNKGTQLAKETYKVGKEKGIHLAKEAYRIGKENTISIGKSAYKLSQDPEIRQRTANGTVGAVSSYAAAKSLNDPHPLRSAAAGFLVGAIYSKNPSSFRGNVKVGYTSSSLSNAVYQSVDYIHEGRDFNMMQLVAAGFAGAVGAAMTYEAPLVPAAIIQFGPELTINKFGGLFYE